MTSSRTTTSIYIAARIRVNRKAFLKMAHTLILNPRVFLTRYICLRRYIQHIGRGSMQMVEHQMIYSPEEKKLVKITI
jgi:hypothetical protein